MPHIFNWNDENFDCLSVLKCENDQYFCFGEFPKPLLNTGFGVTTSFSLYSGLEFAVFCKQSFNLKYATVFI